MTSLRVAVLLSFVYYASGWDWVGRRQKWNIFSMTNEVAADAVLKVKQTVDITKEHCRFISYEVGFIIGQIREKYRLMMELYRVCYSRITGEINFSTPKIYDYYGAWYYRKQEHIFYIAKEIDVLVEVLEKTNIDVEPFPVFLEGHILRMAAEREDEQEKQQRELEEAVKARYREEYLRRRLNASGLPVPSKIINKLPVPGASSLENY